MTKSCLATSASRASSLLTSSEIGVASLLSPDSSWALWRVRQAISSQNDKCKYQSLYCFDGEAGCKVSVCLPTVTGMLAAVRTSSVGSGWERQLPVPCVELMVAY